MLTISKKELLDKYGINLEKGNYTVENLGDKYRINTLKDDTSRLYIGRRSYKR